MSAKRRLIVIEGLDGSGKATQTAKLTAWLKEQGQEVLSITFPDYDSPASAPIKMYLAGEIGEVGDVSAYAASSFYAVDRYVSYQNGWKKQYLLGHTIVADRYVTSNAAHQMSKLPTEEWNSYLRWLEDFEYGRLDLPRPDVVIYLDMDPISSKKLLQGRYGDHTARDIHEENLEYLQNCRKAAGYAADRMGWRRVRCDNADGPLSVEQVFEKIKMALDQKDDDS